MKNQVESEQIKISLNTELKIAENDIVRFLSEELDELDYTALYRAYANKTRSSQVDPSVMFKILVFAYSCGIYTSRKIEEACHKRIDFIWLLDGQPTPDHCAISRFRTRKKSQAALEDLFYQYVQHLEDICETEHGEVFIDGTKRKVAHYRCEDCTGCPYRAACCKAAAEDTQKEVNICWELTDLRKQSLENSTTLKGKNLRVKRSIQVEGAFGQLKNNRGFRRFLTKGNYNVKAELYFLALSQNVKKYHSKCNKKMQQTHLFAPATYLKF